MKYLNWIKKYIIQNILFFTVIAFALVVIVSIEFPNSTKQTTMFAKQTVNALNIATSQSSSQFHKPIMGSFAPGMNTNATNATPTSLSDMIGVATNPSASIISGIGYTPWGGVSMTGDGSFNPSTGVLTVGFINGKTISLGGNFVTTGGYALTLTLVGNSNITLPASGTVATLNSPAFTGNPTVTQNLSLNDSTQSIVYSAWVQSNLPFLSLAEFGVKGTNSTTTNDADIAAACTALGTKGGTLVFPIGSFQTNNPITCGTTIAWFEGQGEGITNIQQYASGGGDAFLFTKAGQSFGGVYNMSITQCGSTSGCSASPVVPSVTTGCAVDLQNGSNIVIRNLAIKQFYNGVCQINVGNTITDSVYVSNYINDAFFTNGQVFGFYTNTYANTATSLNSHASYEFQYTQGFRMTTCGGSNAYYGVLFDPGVLSSTTYQSVGTVDIDNCNFDSANDIGMELNTTGGGTIFQVHVVNSGFSFAGNPGVGIGVQTQGPTGSIVNLSFTDVNVNRSGNQGYQFISGANTVQITGGQIGSNAQTGGAGNNICGVEIDNINNFTLSNAIIGTYLNSTFNGPPTTTTATITNNSVSIAATNVYNAGQQVQFATTVGNIVSGTNYYILSAGLTSSTFEISTTLNGTAITPNSSGSSSVTGGGQFPNTPVYAGNPQCGVLINSSFTGTASLTNNIIQTNSSYDLKQLSTSGTVRIDGFSTIGTINSSSIIPCQKSTATMLSGNSSVAVTFPFTFKTAPSWINAGPFIPSSITTTGFTASTLNGTVSGNQTFYYEADLSSTACQ